MIGDGLLKRRIQCPVGEGIRLRRLRCVWMEANQPKPVRLIDAERGVRSGPAMPSLFLFVSMHSYHSHYYFTNSLTITVRRQAHLVVPRNCPRMCWFGPVRTSYFGYGQDRWFFGGQAHLQVCQEASWVPQACLEEARRY
jgi:hypothetical protein